MNESKVGEIKDCIVSKLQSLTLASQQDNNQQEIQKNNNPEIQKDNNQGLLQNSKYKVN